MTQINSIASCHCDASVHYLDRANSSSLLITMWKNPSLIPQFLFAACTKVTMATHRGDVGRQVWEAYYISRSSSPLPGDPHHLQSQPQRQTIKPKISIFDDHICTWSRKLSATILGRHGVWNLTLLLYDSPASNRIFQSLLLKFVLMRFQKMSAPCDKDRAWRSCGTANEASWQNSDFSIDHRLKTEETEAQMSLKELAQLKAVNKSMHEFSVFSAWGGVFSGHTKGWASSPGCKPETAGDPYRRGINTLREDTGSSGSSACWTKYQAPQTLTFPENAEDVCDSQCNTYALK